MDDTILIGRGREFEAIPRAQWEDQLSRAPEHIRARLAFMTEEHHAVRNFVVRALPRYGSPIPAEDVADRLDIPLGRTKRLLEDLEQRLFFLVLDPEGAVEWAFPVTVASTAHHLLFDTGEKLDAA